MDTGHPARTDAERNRRVLLEAAAGALVLDPDASLAEIARLAGLARATLYRHFSSREKLLEALRDDALSCATAAIADARCGEGSALEALHRVVTGIVSYGGRFRPLLMDIVGKDPEFLRQRQEAFQPIAAIVRRGQDSGDISPDVSVQWILTALTALLAAAVRMNGELDEAGTVEIVFGTLVHGIQDSHGEQN